MTSIDDRYVIQRVEDGEHITTWNTYKTAKECDEEMQLLASQLPQYGWRKLYLDPILMREIEPSA